MKAVFNLFNFSQKVNYKTEILAGFTVAMTMIPESLSFALLAGFPPLMGLYGAFIMGLFTAVFGGRPGLISGGAGATVIVLIALMKSHGLEYVFAAIALAGVFQILVGVFKFGKFIRLVPQSVMYGFVNGLAIVIFLAQISQFKTDTNGISSWLTGNALLTMAGLVLLTITLVYLVPKVIKVIPPALVAIIVVFGLVYFLGIETKTVSDIASVQGGFPPFHIPVVPVNWETLGIIMPYAAIMAGVGLTEGLLTLNLVDEITQTKGNSNRECVAQGGANILNGFFFGMGGCPMIAQTLVNLSAGSRARLSGIIGALTILVIILFGAPVIGKLPIAALTGVMIIVSIGTFEWASLRIFGKMPKSDVIIMLAVTLVTVFLHNLALAVLVGVIIAALVFAWENSLHFRIKKTVSDSETTVYEVFGPLFFGSVNTFNEKFRIADDPKIVIIDFRESRVTDLSAIEALSVLAGKYAKAGKNLRLRHLSPDCAALLHKANAGVNYSVDPEYTIMEP